MDTQPRTMLDHALRYASMGWRVLPVRPRDKRPLIRDWPKLATTDEATIRGWWARWPDANIGVATGPESGIVAIDVDERHSGEESLATLCRRYGPLGETVEGLTGGGGRHLIFRYPDDAVVRNAAGVDGCPGVDIRGDGGFIVVPQSVHPNGRAYEWEVEHNPLDGFQPAELPEAWVRLLSRPAEPTTANAPGNNGEKIVEGGRNDRLMRLGCAMRRQGDDEETIRGALVAYNAARCVPPLDESEVAGIAKSCTRYAPTGASMPKPTRAPARRIEATPRPTALDEAAFHGLAGQIVRAIEPHSEADPAALLIQLLVSFGNIIGRTAHFVADGAWHYLNMFTVLIGDTSKSRKGTSWAHVHRICDGSIDESWARTRIGMGLSSGEGLIWAVRDPHFKTEAARVNGKPTGESVQVMVDAGIDDKRLLVQEAEFATALKVMAREGNTLSPVIRNAWDRGNLQSMTKNSPARATGAHISIVGHITGEELRRYLDTTECANGLGNRIVWLYVQRSKCLPEGGRIDTVDFGAMGRQLIDCVAFARSVGRLERDDAARELWASVYPQLSEGKPGMVGALISRGEAQVMRLASIYALLDRSRLIRPAHLVAALAMWEYAEQSVRYVFGTTVGDPVADDILVALQARPEGMTRTDIRDLFGRHQKGGRIGTALSNLEDLELVWCERTDTRGRPLERWFARTDDATNATVAT
ncbi:MAG: DUF3987 domain-containing protein [Phycisphaerales bacterium]|nr:DUF3987 domain-containing protein [Phycisphaerales bacterium]